MGIVQKDVYLRPKSGFRNTCGVNGNVEPAHNGLEFG